MSLENDLLEEINQIQEKESFEEEALMEELLEHFDYREKADQGLMDAVERQKALVSILNADLYLLRRKLLLKPLLE